MKFLVVLIFILIFAHTYNKDKKNMDKKSFRKKVIDMEVGDIIVIQVGIHSYTTIRSYASDLGFALNRRYKTKRNKENRTYSIIRLS